MHAVDGSGMNPERTLHDDGNWNSHWYSADGDVVNAWFKIDLRGTFNLEKMLVWNVNDSFGHLYLYRNVSRADVFVSNEVAPGPIPTNHASGNGWTLVVANKSFFIGLGRPGLAWTDLIDLRGRTARYVAINVNANRDVDEFGENRTGLAQVQVFGWPAATSDRPASKPDGFDHAHGAAVPHGDARDLRKEAGGK